MKRLFVIVLVMLAGLTQIAQSQVLGIPPSVTSLAPGRQFLPGPSVTSLGPRGFNDVPVLLGRPRFHPQPFFAGPRSFSGRRGHSSRFGAAGTGAVFVPYAVPAYPMIYAEPDETVAEPNVNGAARTYAPDPNYAGSYGVRAPAPVRPETSFAPAPEPASVSEPAVTMSRKVEPQPSTVLVFKDGHKLQVTNYVIQGSTLFNLGDEGPRKIAVADLDVPATVTANDDRGIEFTLPE